VPTVGGRNLSSFEGSGLRDPVDEMKRLHEGLLWKGMTALLVSRTLTDTDEDSHTRLHARTYTHPGEYNFT